MTSPVYGSEPFAGFLFVMEGQAARAIGEPATSNPYELGSPQWSKWLEGWDEQITPEVLLGSGPTR
jgi:hypothetical protein